MKSAVRLQIRRLGARYLWIEGRYGYLESDRSEWERRGGWPASKEVNIR